MLSWQVGRVKITRIVEMDLPPDTSSAMVGRSSLKVEKRIPLRRCRGRLGRRTAHTLRVATTGGTCAARSAGASTASWPMAHNTSALTGK